MGASSKDSVGDRILELMRWCCVDRVEAVVSYVRDACMEHTI